MPIVQAVATTITITITTDALLAGAAVILVLLAMILQTGRANARLATSSRTLATAGARIIATPAMFIIRETVIASILTA